MTQVEQTSATNEVSPQGNTTAYSLTIDSDVAPVVFEEPIYIDRINYPDKSVIPGAGIGNDNGTGRVILTGKTNVYINEDEVGYLSNSTNPTAYTDLTQAFATSINTIRQGIAGQRIRERNARNGTRYREIIKEDGE